MPQKFWMFNGGSVSFFARKCIWLISMFLCIPNTDYGRILYFLLCVTIRSYNADAFFKSPNIPPYIHQNYQRSRVWAILPWPSTWIPYGLILIVCWLASSMEDLKLKITTDFLDMFVWNISLCTRRITCWVNSRAKIMKNVRIWSFSITNYFLQVWLWWFGILLHWFRYFLHCYNLLSP